MRRINDDLENISAKDFGRIYFKNPFEPFPKWLRCVQINLTETEGFSNGLTIFLAFDIQGDKASDFWIFDIGFDYEKILENADEDGADIFLSEHEDDLPDLDVDKDIETAETENELAPLGAFSSSNVLAVLKDKLDRYAEEFGEDNLRQFGLAGIMIRMFDKLHKFKNMLNEEYDYSDKLKKELYSIAGYAVRGIEYLDEE